MRLSQRQTPCAILLALLAAGLAGCSRSHYRLQADAEANCLVDQKAALVSAESAAIGIEVDPRSRMFSPESPDCPAMPPDDPVAHTLIECVDCKRGSKCYRHANRTPFVENPDWLNYLPRNEDGELELDLPAAVQVGLLHSTQYQQEVEDLYLSALDVSFERFQFDTQFFGGSALFFTADGRVRSGTGNASSLLEVSPSNPTSRLRMQKLTATGGELVAGFANSLVWQFAGPDNYTSTTLLDFTLLQPLLRRGGRAFVLEQLTFAERNLLANVRSMERFRRGFYLNIATGANPGPGPARGGFGAVGGPGGFGSVGNIGVGPTAGYIGLLQQTQEVENQRANVARLRASVDLFQANYDAGRIDRFQVDFARLALITGQTGLLNAEASLETSVDAFLVNLGLPPDVEVKLTDDLLDAFQLRAGDLSDLQAEADGLASDLRGEVQSRQEQEEQRQLKQDNAVDEPDREPDGKRKQPEQLPELSEPGALAEDEPGSEAESISPPERDKQPIDPTALASKSLLQLEAVEADYQRLLDAAPTRRENLRTLAGRDEVAVANIDPEVLSVERFDSRVEALRRDLDLMSTAIKALVADSETQPEAEPESPADRPVDSLVAAKLEAEEFSSLLLQLSLVQARIRLDTISIELTELTNEEALQIAMLYRRDIKNARASLVDSWRLIHFVANDLLSDLDLTFSGDLGNVGDNPFDLRGTNGRLRVGVEFDGPLNRLLERNNYREALISFQRARRGFYQFVDIVHQDLRATLRQIRLNEINFELSREAVLAAITQVDITQLRLTEPPPVGDARNPSNTAARDLVDALASLLGEQNDFLGVWVGNEVARLTLEFDLGLMQLDRTGGRIEPGMPLRDFLDAQVPGVEGGPERLPADIVPPKPAKEPAKLTLPVDLSTAQATGGRPAQDPAVSPASFSQPANRPSLRRLPPVAIEESINSVGGHSPR